MFSLDSLLILFFNYLTLPVIIEGLGDTVVRCILFLLRPSSSAFFFVVLEGMDARRIATSESSF